LTFHQLEARSCKRNRSVTKAINSVDPQAKVAIDLSEKRIKVVSVADVSAVAVVLDDVGYPPRRAA
jgi:copper chaperone